MKLYNLDGKVSAVPGGALITAASPAHGTRYFFVNEKGVHECKRDEGLSVEDRIASGVLTDCNPQVLKRAQAELAGTPLPDEPVPANVTPVTGAVGRK